jgi:hypothetical protein
MGGAAAARLFNFTAGISECIILKNKKILTMRNSIQQFQEEKN